ncbi:MAG: hypothetical protein M3331_08515 [Actinomycetota bacterium]|nr:hypothetical protein [Actinomycetota bacterium]
MRANPFPRSRAAAWATLALAAAGLSSCSADAQDNAAANAIELARYLPEDSALVQTVDVAQARRELELPDDANAAPADLRRRSPDSAQSRLVELTSRGFPVVLAAGRSKPKTKGASPLDGTLIRAAAAAQGPVSVSVVSTSEPFDDIAVKLEAAGYASKRDLYLAGRRTPATASGVVADGGSGRVVFAQDERDASRVLTRIDDEAEPGTAAEALGAVSGSVRLAATADAKRSSCVEALAAAQSASGRGAIMAFAISGEKPDPDRFDPSALKALDTGTPSVLVDALLVPFNVARPVGDLTEPITELLSIAEMKSVSLGEGESARDLPPLSRPFDAYDCP